MDNELKAILYSKVKPTESQEQKLKEFLVKKYGNISMEWCETEDIESGFRLEVGQEVYDWTKLGRLEQFKEMLQSVKGRKNNDNIIPLIKENLKDWTPKGVPVEYGKVISIGDGIASVEGLYI